ncbi:DUF6445 family protein [Brevundimonas sp. Leaf363]|uniref:DUF6445 family protein n=1 Tax=Brevundimonas sp. Leaf363 TaxID=1736353 RepID=UPI0012E222A8|nr:DUF6445 family protein [Brevundimonas sp. Leaf363]
MNPAARPQMAPIAPGVPAIIIDNFYQNPEAIREAALDQSFSPATAMYPGRLATFTGQPSLLRAVDWVKNFVNQQLLPRIPLTRDGQRVTRFETLQTDFGIVDTLPQDLAPAQRAPHVDPAPIFGIVYLNEEDRGGTAFFRKTDAERQPQREGYFADTDAGFEKVGRIDGVFNRLAIYPGFIWHTAEVGDWITSDARIRSPRLTQRLVFVD